MKKIKEFLQSFFLRVSLQDQILLARHLSLMVKSGMPLLDAIQCLKNQTKSKSLVKILTSAITDVSNGQFLFMALGKYINVFGELFINIVKIGETSGTLAEDLEYLSGELKKKRELRKKIISASLYPIIILIATLGVVTLLTLFLFPKILPVFEGLKTELPITTRILIAISDFLINYGGYVLLGLFAFLVITWLLLQLRGIRKVYQGVLLYVPVVGGVIKNINMTTMTRTLGLLLRSGVKIIEALNIAADTTPNLIYKAELKEAAENIRKGGSIASHLMTRKRLFPIMATNMIEVGETTGNLNKTLFYLAEFYEAEVNETTTNMSNLLEPVLMIILGSIVGFVAISIITPIYGISQSVGR